VTAWGVVGGSESASDPLAAGGSGELAGLLGRGGGGGFLLLGLSLGGRSPIGAPRTVFARAPMPSLVGLGAAAFDARGGFPGGFTAMPRVFWVSSSSALR